ncbi:MAG TPA: hypothetical protein VFH47_06145 [Candidatus Thermoplasmatota archaeon]|nr:hypothetical protein [Candidatus Thermoplasmatota archaeon]
MRSLLVPMTLALLAGAMLAGCSEGQPPAAAVAGPRNRDAPAEEAAARAGPVENGDPVRIDETGDIVGPFSGTWEWEVRGNVSRFEVRLELAGPRGAPLGQAGAGTYARLAGGSGNETVVRSAGSEGATSVSASLGNGSTCLMCLDGVRSGFPQGRYVLAFGTELTAATYRVSVTVDYA